MQVLFSYLFVSVPDQRVLTKIPRGGIYLLSDDRLVAKVQNFGADESLLSESQCSLHLYSDSCTMKERLENEIQSCVRNNANARHRL